MTDQSIIFGPAFINAIVAGRKTQHREPIEVQPQTAVTSAGNRTNSRISGLSAWTWFSGDPQDSETWHPLAEFTLPYAIGSRRWIREAWRTTPAYDDLAPSAMSGEEPVRWEADTRWKELPAEDNPYNVGRLRYARYMPDWASRGAILIRNIKIQRVQEITDADAMAEGIVSRPDGVGFWMPGVEHPNSDFPYLSRPTLREMFAALWDTVHGSGSWGENPWVSAIVFDFARAID